MSSCSFCGRPAEIHASSLRLCAECRRQIMNLSPESAAYIWYVRAVRRALFGDYASA